ncbi:recombinase family protein [uncultured Micrococcus sp.]|uniref:recombinase family protein n=1 Tax=uncultured Micrococcus sp. TaxID=114051 RepID=UPI00261223E7|nr:recombinase family protein [uncultured Micrococcus sp.]
MSVQAGGIYARISRDDEGMALGVARQLEDCRREAERRGWPILREYVDNDVSASNGRLRPEYAALLDDIARRDLDALVVWDVDRLTRTPAELETFIDLSDRHHVALASIGGDVDLSTPQGRLTARIKGSVARHEVEQQSRRLRRKFQASAAQGVPHGRTPFGYRRERQRDPETGAEVVLNVVYPPEAALIRDWYARVIAGESLRSIARDMNERGVTTTRGNKWSGAVLGHTMRRPVMCGLRVHKGEIVGPGNWEPIVDRDTWERAVAVLSDPSRRPGRGPMPRYLGSGIYRCGKCGGKMRPIVQAKEAPIPRAPAYGCESCHKLTRKLEAVDEVVEAVIIARLEREDTALDLAADPSVERQAREVRDAALARLDNAADQYADGTITARQLARITDRLKPELGAAEARLQRLQSSSVVHGMTGPGAGKAWRAAPLEKKRAVLNELASITILPSGPGVRFSPEQVRITWKGQDDD